MNYTKLRNQIEKEIEEKKDGEKTKQHFQNLQDLGVPVL